MLKRLLVAAMITVLASSFFAGLFSPPECRAEENVIRVRMETNRGVIILELNQEKAPITVANFLQYVDDGFYDGLIFHRVVKDFVIQGGGFDKNMQQKQTRAPIQNEAGNGLSNAAYTIAMARTMDPNSATSQFYINLQDNPNLNKSPASPGYAVFGKVVHGKDVVDAIGRVNTTVIAGYPDVPAKSVVIRSVTRTTVDDDGSGGGSGGSSDSSTCFVGMLR